MKETNDVYTLALGMSGIWSGPVPVDLPIPG